MELEKHIKQLESMFDKSLVSEDALKRRIAAIEIKFPEFDTSKYTERLDNYTKRDTPKRLQY